MLIPPRPSWTLAAAGCAVSFATGFIVSHISTLQSCSHSSEESDACIDEDLPLDTSDDTLAVAPSTSALKLGHLNSFLHSDCAPVLMAMGLFSNGQDVTESMACLHAVDKHLPTIRFADKSTVCLVVGDGVALRTAALFAMRTKWRRIISVDGVRPGGSLTDVQVRKGMQSQQQLAKLQRQMQQLQRVERLEMLTVPLKQVVLDLDPVRDHHLVIVLPHAHVVPESVLKSVRTDTKAVVDGTLPSISIVQLPCCSFAKYKTICGATPDVENSDDCICSERHGREHLVRIWKNIASAAVNSHILQQRDSKSPTE